MLGQNLWAQALKTGETGGTTKQMVESLNILSNMSRQLQDGCIYRVTEGTRIPKYNHALDYLLHPENIPSNGVVIV